MVKFGEIAREVRTVWKEMREGVPVVGLEHIVPGEMELKKYDLPEENTFTKKFCKGQVLFGRRRAYQKKATVATFDGICSGDITVIEPIPGMVVPELLPFIVANDRFFDHAIQGSAGSLSPRVKWEHMANYEFELPTLGEQKVLSNKLWAAYRLKEAYQRLLNATDEMEKSQFLEMFGNAKRTPLVDVCLKSGEYGSNSPADDYDGNIRYVRITDITDEGNLNNLLVSPRKIEEKYLLVKDDLLFARTGNTVGKTYLHNEGKMVFAGYLIRYKLNKNIVLPQFAFAYTHTNDYYVWVEKTKKIGAQPNISATQYDEMPIPTPPLSEQKAFVSIAEQADKSKFDGFKSQFLEMFGEEAKWKIMPLKDIVHVDCPISYGIVQPGDDLEDGISIVRPVDMTSDLYIGKDGLKKTSKAISESYRRTILRGDEILLCVRGTTGLVNLAKSELAGCNVTRGITPLYFKDNINPRYVYCVLTSPKAQQYIADHTHGSTLKGINMEDVRNLPIPIPSLEVQNQCESILIQADKSKFELRKAISAIDEVIKSLING